MENCLRKLKPEYVAVIKACKGHFHNDGYKAAKVIIRDVIYGRGNTEILWSELEYLKEVLLQARTWTIQQWENLNQEILRDVYTSRHYMFDAEKNAKFDNRKDLFRDYCDSLCSQIQSLQVWSESKGELLDLSLEFSYYQKVQDALDKHM